MIGRYEGKKNAGYEALEFPNPDSKSKTKKLHFKDACAEFEKKVATQSKEEED